MRWHRPSIARVSRGGVRRNGPAVGCTDCLERRPQRLAILRFEPRWREHRPVPPRSRPGCSSARWLRTRHPARPPAVILSTPTPGVAPVLTCGSPDNGFGPRNVRNMCVPSGDSTRRSGVGSGEKCPQCPAFWSISGVGTIGALPDRVNHGARLITLTTTSVAVSTTQMRLRPRSATHKYELCLVSAAP